MVTQRRPTARAMTAEEAFMVKEVASESSVTHQGPDADNLTTGTTIQHERRGRVLMWKPGGDGRYTPREVAENSRAILMGQGWKFACPDCGTNHEDSQYPPEDPNSCPGRQAIAWSQCPVCGKRQFDNMQWKTVETNPDASDASAMVVDEEANNSTPRERVLLIRNLHMWSRHPRQSQMMNIPPLPTALREIVDGMRAVK